MVFDEAATEARRTTTSPAVSQTAFRSGSRLLDMGASTRRNLRIVGGALIALGILVSFVPQYTKSLWSWTESRHWQPEGVNCTWNPLCVHDVTTPFSQGAVAANRLPLTFLILFVVAGVVLLVVAGGAASHVPGQRAASSAIPAKTTRPAAPATRPLSEDVEVQLRRLRELHAAGVLTDEDLARGQRRAIHNDQQAGTA